MLPRAAPSEKYNTSSVHLEYPQGRYNTSKIFARYDTSYILNHGVVDCEWDDWMIGECDKDCGGGMRTNIRAVKSPADHGGKECTGASSVDESCNVQECPGYW